MDALPSYRPVNLPARFQTVPMPVPPGARRKRGRGRTVDGVTGPGPPSRQAALATALLGGALRAACLEGGRSSLTLMV